MKSKILFYIIGIISGIILSAIAAILYIDWTFTQPCSDPEKPSNVPPAAAYIGGCDGGHWMELVSITDKKVRFRIYRDWNGELLLDADFKYDGCAGFRLTSSDWTKHVAFFENYIHIYDHSAGVNCKLLPVYPAYFKER